MCVCVYIYIYIYIYSHTHKIGRFHSDQNYTISFATNREIPTDRNRFYELLDTKFELRRLTVRSTTIYAVCGYIYIYIYLYICVCMCARASV